MTRILFYLDEFSHTPWKTEFLKLDPAINFRGNPDWGSPDDGPAYAITWKAPSGLLKKYPNIKAIFSMGAGVDHLLSDPDLPRDIPIIRMGDDGLREGMAEFVTMNVLMHHRQMPEMLAAQKKRKWIQVFSKAANDVSVGILGYGALGDACGEALLPLGYNIATWSRTQKAKVVGLTHFTGTNEFEDFLKRTDILVGLLPSTPETTNLLDKKTLSMLPAGASIINAGRGSLIVLDDLHALLDSGHIASATLDVFPEEPLPNNHALWVHDKVIITPHIAAITRPKSAAEYILRNIKKLENGEEPENKLNIKRGY